MPFISVEILKGRTMDQRREFARRVTPAAVQTTDAKPTAVRITFRELDPTELAHAATMVIDEEGFGAGV